MMVEIPEIAEEDKKKMMIYAFRFSNTNERVCLTEDELGRIPYLSTLLAHEDNFSTIKNENGEYVLNPPIYYNWFMPILRSINLEQPYTLFTELREGENVLYTLQLFDYLGIHAFDSPILKGQYLALLNPISEADEKRRAQYHRANLSEARNTAAQFIISISKNEYDLHDSNTAQSVFDLILVILSNNSIFSSRFRHHTLTIVKKYCLSVFSKKQWRQLPTTQEIIRSNAMDSWVYLYDDDQCLPGNFENAFAWKGVYKLIKENRTFNRSFLLTLLINGEIGVGKHSFIGCSCDFSDVVFDNVCLSTNDAEASLVNKNRHGISEAQSARSRHFNTLPKRSNIDKFKHRSGPKTQKYR